MRTIADRLRHALSFEIIALLIIIPAGQLLFDLPIHQIGTVALVGSLVATFWVYGYNYLFDLALLRTRRNLNKSLPMRLAHALLFEFGLLLILLPFIAWYLGVSLFDAFLTDIALVAFYIVYSFAFNWLYDLLFPLKREMAQPSTSRN